ncbi:hypothetical protein [Wolbachia endosymbiont of Ctenocephalides felis wCfeJ]|nr:hypothetical protein [Wolbachia endosymbiont of Ctenocephalides felis wCfeJ]
MTKRHMGMTSTILSFQRVTLESSEKKSGSQCLGTGMTKNKH